MEFLAGIKAHAEREAPFECCGYISLDGKAVPLENAAQNRTTQWLIAPHEQVRMRRAGFLGIYHSHVDRPAYISPQDAEGAWDFGRLYIVASVIAGSCREQDIQVWRLMGNHTSKDFVRQK